MWNIRKVMELKKVVYRPDQPRTPAAEGGGPKSIQKATPEAGGRSKAVRVVKPVVYGNVAWYLGSKREEDGHTHQWHVYLKPYDDDDMSVYVKRVHFKLHESYANPTRVLHAPPYEITETGWGEFEIGIEIFFRDIIENSATIYHYLKLFDRDMDGNVTMGTGTVTSENYKGLVFMDPTAKMYRHLTHNMMNIPTPPSHETDYEEEKVQDLNKIMEAKNNVEQEIADLKAALASAKENILKLKSQVAG